MIHVQIWRSAKKRTKVATVALAGVLAIVAAAVVWFTVQNTPYRNRTGQYLQDMQSVLHEAPLTLKQFRNAPDAARSAAALDTLAATLSQKAQQPPAAPHIFGITWGTTDEQARVKRAHAAADAFTTKLKEAAAFITYQTQVAGDLQLLSLKDAANYDQIKQLATQWQQSSERISRMTHPAKLTEVSAALLQKMTQVHDMLVRLADLHKANDEAGFTAAQKELAAAMATLKPLGEQIAAAAQALDTELAQAFAALTQSL